MPGIRKIGINTHIFGMGGGGFVAEYYTAWKSFINKPSNVLAVTQNELVVDWVSDGGWSKRDIVYILATNNAANAHINWITPSLYTLLPINSPLFTPLRGYAGNGSNAKLNSQFSPASQSTKSLQNDASMGIHSQTEGIVNEMEAGGDDGPNGIDIKVRYSGTILGGHLNDGTLGARELAAFGNTGKGLYRINRKLAANYQAFINGVDGGNIVRTSTGLVAAPLQILANGVAGQFTTRQLSMMDYGGSVTDAEELAFNTAYQTYIDRLRGERVPLIVDESVHIYGDTLANIPITNTLVVTYSCTIGSVSGNDFIITPSASGEEDLRIVVRDGGVVIRDTISRLILSDKVNTGSKTITIIGDSLVSAGGDNEINELNSFFDLMTWTGIGTQTTGGIQHEGHTGKTYDWLVNHADSPFTKSGVVDIPAYYTDNALAVPNFIYMRMGVNGAFAEGAGNWTEADKDTWIADINELIDAFLAHNGSVEIIIGLPTISENTGDGWEVDYPGNTNQDNYIKIIHQMWDAIIANYEGDIHNTRVSVAYAPWFLDRDEGYPKTDDVHTNGVHPDASGYVQLGQGLAAKLNELL